MAVSEAARVSHLEAWTMPYRYAVAVVDLAIERQGESGGPARPTKAEPVTTPGGQVLPPGMSQMARMFGWA